MIQGGSDPRSDSRGDSRSQSGCDFASETRSQNRVNFWSHSGIDGGSENGTQGGSQKAIQGWADSRCECGREDRGHVQSHSGRDFGRQGWIHDRTQSGRDLRIDRRSDVRSPGASPGSDRGFRYGSRGGARAMQRPLVCLLARPSNGVAAGSMGSLPHPGSAVALHLGRATGMVCFGSCPLSGWRAGGGAGGLTGGSCRCRFGPGARIGGRSAMAGQRGYRERLCKDIATTGAVCQRCVSDRSETVLLAALF